MKDNKDTALLITNLHKEFRLPHEKKNSLKERVINFSKPTYEQLHVLKDINLEVKRGEFFGIVGRNGSGKSTLLKIIGGIYQPTHGKVQVNGTLTPFIELGIGFNPELTGRENVYLNGAILGLTRKEVVQKYQEIVDFAELEKFMDQKLKNYSSGMQVRLAFSIAIQAHNDILLIDEVLAVGDANFQRKCFDVFKDIKKQGKTVVFVTHDMGAVQEYCDRALMLQDSKILMIGKPREIALRYEVANSKTEEQLATEQKNETMSRPKKPAVKILSMVTRTPIKKTQHFSQGEDIIIDIEFRVNQKIEPLQFNLFLVKPDGTYLAGINTVNDLRGYSPSIGYHQITCRLKTGQLAKGDYYVNIAIYTYQEPVKLIDVFDTSYGVEVPKITILEKSLYQNGEFFIQGKWTQSEKTN